MWAPRPSAGPHKLRECLPVILCLRNRLKYALTKKEALMICMERHVKVDGRIRTDPNFPAGFMDVLELEASQDKFRLLYDTKGRFVLCAWIMARNSTSSAVSRLLPRRRRTSRTSSRTMAATS